MTHRVDFLAYPAPSMAVACPGCGAVVGAFCRRPSGHAGPMVGLHRERRAEADRIWLAQGDPPITKNAAGRWIFCPPGTPEDAHPRRHARRCASPSPTAPPSVPRQAALF